MESELFFEFAYAVARGAKLRRERFLQRAVINVPAYLASVTGERAQGNVEPGLVPQAPPQRRTTVGVQASLDHVAEPLEFLALAARCWSGALEKEHGNTLLPLLAAQRLAIQSVAGALSPANDRSNPISSHIEPPGDLSRGLPRLPQQKHLRHVGDIKSPSRQWDPPDLRRANTISTASSGVLFAVWR